MWHMITAPILLPMLTALLIMLPPIHYSAMRRRWVSIFSSILQLLLVVLLLLQVQQHEQIHYAIGNWQAPFGIILVADKLAVIMVGLTTFLSLGAICYGGAGEDEKGSFFHPLFQFQLMGINGAFLTGDLFNLFVFFEVLLIASYALLIHAGGKNKTKAAVPYVVLNLTGSAIFLISLAILYGTLGTLNIADMAQRVAALPAENVMLVKAGGLALLIVFALKAAVLPLQFWLPATYSSASAPVAALFAVMTKIGIYALLRVYSSIFGAGAGELAGLGSDLLWLSGLATIALGAIGVVASEDIRKVVANLVLVSVGTLVSLAAIRTEFAASAAMYYSVHSTLATAALFLIADMIANQRGKAGDRLVAARRVAQPVLLGSLFFIGMLSVVGLPPFSGFIGKLIVLQAAVTPGQKIALWSLVLLSSLALIIAISRAGSTVFWRINGNEAGPEKAEPLQVFAVIWLLAASPLLVMFAGPATTLTTQAAAQLFQKEAIYQSVLQQSGESTP